ncbi:MAG: Asp23/Gls24 family envelope stress response protein [Clostridia bacterium]|nr:Asp23/Gls24 family envelope stress response protein [Clostridia bacterium]
MSNIKLGSLNVQSGKIVYNADIVQEIIAIAVTEVEGALPLDTKTSGISIRFDKDAVYADVSVVAKYGYDVPELAYRIQQSVIHSVENMTSYKVAKVDVHVVDVKFCEPQSVEPEKEEEEEVAEN